MVAEATKHADLKCTACVKRIQDGDVGYELNKGTFTETEEGFVFEHVAGRYHEACLPDMPLDNVEDVEDDEEDEDEEDEDEDGDTNR